MRYLTSLILFGTHLVIKMKNKPDLALVGGSYLIYEIKKGQKNLVRLSL
jgi:hypothetical protein